MCLKMGLLCTCFVFFAIQVELFFSLYMESATTLGITYQKMHSKAYPSITFCPEYILKESGNAINRQDFDQLSYKVVVSFNKYLEFNLKIQSNFHFFRKTSFTVLQSKILREGYGISRRHLEHILERALQSDTQKKLEITICLISQYYYHKTKT